MTNWKVLKDGEEINTIVADKAFAMIYAEMNGYTVEEMPEPEPVPEAEPTPTIEERVTTLEERNAEMTEALDMILSGVTE